MYDEDYMLFDFIVGACSACKVGEHMSVLLRDMLPRVIQRVIEEANWISDVNNYHSMSDEFLKILNDILIHNLFDIKHLMQHEVKLLKYH